MGDFFLREKRMAERLFKLPKLLGQRFVQRAYKRSMPSMFCIEGILAQTHTPEESTTCKMFLCFILHPHYIKIAVVQQPPIR